MLTERQRIRILAQTKKERLKTEAIDILIDALHRETRGGATVSFDHNLALKIEKLIIGNMQRAKIIALVRTGIHKPCDSSRELGKLGPRMTTSVSTL
jgi:hypothetical protein